MHQSASMRLMALMNHTPVLLSFHQNQIWGKSCFVNQFLVIISQEFFANAMVAQLLWHVLSFVVINRLEFGWDDSSNLNCHRSIMKWVPANKTESDKHFDETLFIIMHYKLLDLSTVECHYNAVQYSKILYKWLHELTHNINQMLDPQKTPHTLP